MDSAVFVYRRRIQWRDCDPAGIAFTGTLLDLAMEAIDAWWRDVIGSDSYQLNTTRGIGAPMVRVELNFRAMLLPGDQVGIAVRVARIGDKSIHFEIDVDREDGAHAFDGKLICALVDSTRNRAVRVPDDIRLTVGNYMTACQSCVDGTRA